MLNYISTSSITQILSDIYSFNARYHQQQLMKLLVFCILLISVAFCVAQNQCVNFNVITDGTRANGNRMSNTEYYSFNAPEGHCFYEETFKVDWNTQIGSENIAEISERKTQRGKLVGIIIRVHARSKGGLSCIGCRGISKGQACIQMGPC